MLDIRPKLPAISQADLENAETADFNATSLPSCYYYLCENSFGFTTTHPKYNEETWLKPLQAETLAYHGESAMAFLQAAIDLTGMGDYEGTFPNFGTTVIELLQAAAVQSEYHRGLRTHDDFLAAAAAFTGTKPDEWEQVVRDRLYRHKTDGRVARTARESGGNVQTRFGTVRVEVSNA